jgi:hypothetical protein
MVGPEGNPTAANLFNIIACLQEHEGVRLQVAGAGEVEWIQGLRIDTLGNPAR